MAVRGHRAFGCRGWRIQECRAWGPRSLAVAFGSGWGRALFSSTSATSRAVFAAISAGSGGPVSVLMRIGKVLQQVPTELFSRNGFRSVRPFLVLEVEQVGGGAVEAFEVVEDSGVVGGSAGAESDDEGGCSVDGDEVGRWCGGGAGVGVGLGVEEGVADGVGGSSFRCVKAGFCSCVGDGFGSAVRAGGNGPGDHR